jgi:acetyl-CoA C-acetyltransferase
MNSIIHETSRPQPDHPVYIVDGARTPFLRARGTPGPFSASDLVVAAGRPLLARQLFDHTALDEVILGCVAPGPDEANIARVAALRLGCGERVTAWTVQRNCGSGLQAIDTAAQSIASGPSNLVLAGGTEAMSHHPVLLSTQMVIWLAAWSRARGLLERARQLTRLRPAHLQPVIGLLRGLTDPIVGFNMGQTAEQLAWRFDISRTAMDDFALESHQRAVKAQAEGWLSEIEPIFDDDGCCFEQDDGVRADTDLDQLGRLRPVFGKPTGKVATSNSA